MRKIVCILIAVLFGSNVRAEEGTKEFKQNFPASSFNELIVSNRYGNIDIRQGGEEFAVTATVWVEAKNRVKVDEILEFISITAKERGAALNVETVFKKDISLKQLFSGVTVSVDYHIQVPAGKKVRLLSTDGGVSLTDFTGDLSVEIVSGNFKANTIRGGEFSIKQSKGEFEAEKVAVFHGEFKSCKVKIGEGTDMKIDCNSTDLQLMEAENLTLKTSGGTCYLGMVENLTGNSSYTKHEVQEVGDRLWMDVRWGELNVRNVHTSFSLVEVKGFSTKVGLTFMEGCGYALEINRNKKLKVELPRGVALEVKPTARKNTVLETGFVGDKKYSGRVNLDLSGGSLFIQ